MSILKCNKGNSSFEDNFNILHCFGHFPVICCNVSFYFFIILLPNVKANCFLTGLNDYFSTINQKLHLFTDMRELTKLLPWTFSPLIEFTYISFEDVKLFTVLLLLAFSCFTKFLTDRIRKYVSISFGELFKEL